MYLKIDQGWTRVLRKGNPFFIRRVTLITYPMVTYERSVRIIYSNRLINDNDIVIHIKQTQYEIQV